MKRQVLHRERAHLKVPGCSLVLSALLTKKLWRLAGQLRTMSTKAFSSQSVTSTVKTKYSESIFQGHPTSKLSQTPVKRDVFIS